MKLSFLCSSSLLAAHHAEAFSLRMQSFSNLPPALRQIAPSPPPSSVLTLRVATASASTTATVEEAESSTLPGSKTKTLGLLTFDLDDSLYPIEPVLHDANEIFVQTMSNYGYSLEPNDIVEAGKAIRQEAGPIAGTAMSHTEVRLEAIRREMERKMLEKKLQECAEDWATEVESLTGPIRRSAEKWAKSAVAESVVEIRTLYPSIKAGPSYGADFHISQIESHTVIESVINQLLACPNGENHEDAAATQLVSPAVVF